MVERAVTRKSAEEIFQLIDHITEKIGPWVKLNGYKMDFTITPFDSKGTHIVNIKMYEQNTVQGSNEKSCPEA